MAETNYIILAVRHFSSDHFAHVHFLFSLRNPLDDRRELRSIRHLRNSPRGDQLPGRQLRDWGGDYFTSRPWASYCQYHDGQAHSGADNSRCDDQFTCEISALYPEFCPDCDFDVKITPSDRKYPSRHIYGYFRVIRAGANNSRYDDIFACETSAPYPELCLDSDFDVKITVSDHKYPSVIFMDTSG